MDRSSPPNFMAAAGAILLSVLVVSLAVVAWLASGNLIVMVLAFFALALTGGAWFWLEQRILGPMSRTTEVMNALCEGTADLGVRIGLGGSDAGARLCKSFDRLAARLQAHLAEVETVQDRNRALSEHLAASARISAESVSDLLGNLGSIEEETRSLDGDMARASEAVTRINDSFRTLASQVEQQNEAVQRSSAAIEEIMASVSSVARISESRNTAINELVGRIDAGRRQVKTTNSIIEEVARTTDAILSFTALIDDIAAKTNLLAMNAAIEAAHAGEAGRGFAVVAGEIRKLAADTATNASRITATLKQSTERIRQASSAGKASEAALEEINAEVNVFAQALGEVSNSMQELHLASTEILDSIGTMLSSSERVSQGTGSIRHVAEEVVSVVSHLKEVSTNTLTEVQSTYESSDAISKTSLQVAAFTNQNRYHNFLLARSALELRTGLPKAAAQEEVRVGIEWSDLMKVGVDQVDQEHRALFDQVNTLVSFFFGAPPDIGKLKTAIDFIADYVVRHFTNEEALMKKTGYPKLEEHHRIHEEFKADFGLLARQLQEQGFTAAMLIHVQDKVVNWLLDHIAVTDMDFGRFYQESAAGRQPEKAGKQ